jgi:DNA-binding response OmpR family regulator
MMLQAALQPLSPALALLVDHDDDTRHMYAEYLKRAACEIDEATDGREGLAKAISRRPSVVVTETRLPGMNGFDLCRLLRRDLLTQSIPIVVVTGSAQVSDIEHARTAGADIVLLKPCLPEVLLKEIRRLTEHSRELRERGDVVRLKLAGQLAKSGEILERSATQRRKFLARSHDRHETTSPKTLAPELICPRCDQSLIYQRSHIGGVSERHSEQWDYYECPGGCGTFQYRQRTRKLRRVE